MKGTCLKEKCIFWDKHSKDGKVCPFYRETVWTNDKDNQTTVIEDCAPVRAMFMQMDDHNNTMGVKQLVNEIRNTMDELKGDTKNFMISFGGEMNSLKRNSEQLLLGINKEEDKK